MRRPVSILAALLLAAPFIHVEVRLPPTPNKHRSFRQIPVFLTYSFAMSHD